MHNSKIVKKIAWRYHKWSKSYVFSYLCVFLQVFLSTCTRRMENRFDLKTGIP